MSSVRKKFGIQLIASNAETVGHFALSIVLARLLTPDDIGVYSMSAILVAIAHIFRDFGVSSFIKRQKELTPEAIRSALGVVMFTSWSVALLLYLGSSHWAGFFGEPRVERVVEVLALGFVFIPFGAIPGAILVRNLEVVRTAKAGLASLAVYITASVVLAWQGAGYMTMAWANLIHILAHCVAIRWVSLDRAPIIPSLKGWSHIANFGVGTIMTSSLRALDNAIPDVMLGRLSTPAAVGLFSRANSTVNIASSALMPAVNYFALPYLARLHHRNEDLAAEVCKITSYLATLLLPALALTAILAQPIVLFLYGAQWLPSAAAIPWLCVATGMGVLFFFTQPALTGIGKPYLAGLPMAALIAIKVGVAWWLFDGTLARFAQSLMLGQFIALPVVVWVNRRFLHIGVRQWLRSVLPVLLMTALTVAAALLVEWLLPPMPPLLHIVALGLPSLAVWVAATVALRLPLGVEVTAMLARRKAPKA
ncbi:oligosaccharide flippase family protein [Hydrogenophaga sp. T2]|uniref:oligosaccharide flippase family protein n=1 Tax=Hydrogenophaga sp. T2 TaxID=3132823 RepID=UPI003CF9F887